MKKLKKMAEFGFKYRKLAYKTFAGCAVLISVAPSAHAFTLAYSELVEGWNTTELTINVNYTGCSISGARLDAAIETAMNVWNDAPTSSIRLKRGGTTTSSGKNTLNPPFIACETAFDVASTNQQHSVGGISFARPSSGDVLDGGYLLLNTMNGAGANISGLTDLELSLLIAHELGHVLGLGHSSEQKALMYYSITGKQELRLSQDDIDGITFLYPRQEIGQNGLMGCGSLAVLGHKPQGKGPGSRGSPGSPGSPWSSGAAEMAILLLICASMAYALRSNLWSVSRHRR